MYTDIDENSDVGEGLDDKKFVKSREAILTLLPKLFKEGSSKWSTLEFMELLVDETVEEIAKIWTEDK